jgi:glycosyltransferase involved in cell wall biosynthesis
MVVVALRILFVNPAAELGGGERCLLDLMASLKQAAPTWELHVLTFGDGPFLASARALGVTARPLPYPKPLARLGESQLLDDGFGFLASLARASLELAPFTRSLLRGIREVGPDLVHTHGIKAHFLANAVADRRLPFAFHFQDFPSDRPLSRHLLRSLRRTHAIVLGNSRAVAEDAHSVLARYRAFTLYNTVDTGHYVPGPAEPEWLAELAGLPPLPPGGVSFGLVAAYARWKGHDVFIRAAAEARRRAPDLPLRFYVVGGPIYATNGSQFTREELVNLARELGVESSLAWVPFQADVTRVYRSLDVVVHASSRREPFGRVIVEAMSCGRCVIAARAGGAAELFDDGRSALGFAPGEPRDLARAMLELAHNPERRAALGGEGRRQAATFDRARMGPELIAAYDELLARERPR